MGRTKEGPGFGYAHGVHLNATRPSKWLTALHDRSTGLDHSFAQNDSGIILTKSSTSVVIPDPSNPVVPNAPAEPGSSGNDEIASGEASIFHCLPHASQSHAAACKHALGAVVRVGQVWQDG